MKETGIIMTGNHPRLILDGLKIMTRRTYGLEETNKHPDAWEYQGLNGFGDHLFYPVNDYPNEFDGVVKCPYGGVGDKLWVREAYLYDPVIEGGIVYKADNLEIPSIVKWKPFLFMFRKDSRIEEIIALLRVERLRDISPIDAKREGSYAVEEFIKTFLRLNHLPEDANPWNWVIGW